MNDYDRMCADETYRWNGAYGTPGKAGPNGYSTKDQRGRTKGIMRLRREQKRREAEECQAACTDHGRAREIREGYRLPNGQNRSGVTKIHDRVEHLGWDSYGN